MSGCIVSPCVSAPQACVRDLQSSEYPGSGVTDGLSRPVGAGKQAQGLPL